MRIFMEGQEEWLEPCGRALVIFSKVLLAPLSCISLIWALISVLAGRSPTSGFLDHPPVIAAIVSGILAFAFWLAGKASISLDRWMRERGLKLP
jgi:hypothetical protein